MPLTPDYISLLQRLIATESISRHEDATADILEEYLNERGIPVERVGNNIIARSLRYDPLLPTLLLNSHHDTVKPNAGYTRNPFEPIIENGRLYGLGSNDAGASLVSLITTFIQLYDCLLPFNLVLALSAEEECSGSGGMRMIIDRLGKVDMAIVGEPTLMRCAIGERGLVVLDCTTHGVSGHAARGEGVNALYKAVDDINILRNLTFPRQSALMGPVGINVTMIDAGTQHNVVPATCHYVVDVRTTDAYTNEETIKLIADAVDADVTPRSTHLRASAIDESHPLVRAVKLLGIDCFLSPTMSDMALMPFPSIKIGPGNSARSHSADEFIYLDEIEQAIPTYLQIIHNLENIFTNEQ